ncbi:MAG TPA: sigma-70 family RNA polymerase sigma factor [Gaiellaceae bacterium]|nr:sigma-70 family RNA polymerase sigma factor [Gaiellaceae bacterium]
MIPARDEALVAALRAGDRDVLARLVRGWSNGMLRLAAAYVDDRAAAEEVVQDAWIAVLEGIDRFQGRAALRTWVFRIVANLARRRAARERRTVPLSALGGADEPPVEPERFVAAGRALAGHWADPPRALTAEERLLAAETRARLLEAIRDLPPGQRAVITLRDVDGWSAEDVCATLELTRANQRVLLHRARSSVRRALAPYLEEGGR